MMNHTTRYTLFLYAATGFVVCAVLVIVLSMISGWAQAQSNRSGNTTSQVQQPVAQHSRVGFVDIPYLIDQAPQALEAEQRLETEFAPRQQELEAQRARLAELAERLASATVNELSEAEIARLDRESRSLERRIKRSEQDFREELNIEKNVEFKKVRILVLETIAQFGEQNDYDLIVSDGVLFANKRIDVTERILESLILEFSRLQSAN